MDSVWAGLSRIQPFMAATLDVSGHSCVCHSMVNFFSQRAIHSHRPSTSWPVADNRSTMVRCNLIDLVFVDRNVAWHPFTQSHAGDHPARIRKMAGLDICLTG